MVLQLKQVLDNVGGKQSFSYELDGNSLDTDYFFDSPIAVNGVVENRAGIVTLSYSCSFEMRHVCDRCLSEFVRRYDCPFRHTLVRSSVNDDYIVCPDNTLTMDGLVLSDLLLELPTKILCSEACKGLCCNCGANLNLGECRCKGSE